MVKKVCLDTQILIWAIQKYSSPSQADMLDKASNLIELLVKQRAKVIIPSVVIFELLMGVQQVTADDSLKIINKHFSIASFDVMGAREAAKVWNQRQVAIGKAKPGTEKPNKNQVKADCQIIATAIVNKCDCICSEDPDLRKFGSAFIQIMTIQQLLEDIQPLPLIDTMAYTIN